MVTKSVSVVDGLKQIEQDYLIYIGGLERVVNLWKAGSYADRLPIKLV